MIKEKNKEKVFLSMLPGDGSGLNPEGYVISEFGLALYRKLSFALSSSVLYRAGISYAGAIKQSGKYENRTIVVLYEGIHIDFVAGLAKVLGKENVIKICQKCHKNEAYGFAVGVLYCSSCAHELGEQCTQCGYDGGNGAGGYSNCCGAELNSIDDA